MPSPEDFHRDIRAAKRFGLVQGLLLLPSMFSLILAIAFAVGGDWREAAVTAGICAVFIGVLVCLERRQKRLRRESTRYYTFPLFSFMFVLFCGGIEYIMNYFGVTYCTVEEHFNIDYRLFIGFIGQYGTISCDSRCFIECTGNLTFVASFNEPKSRTYGVGIGIE